MLLRSTALCVAIVAAGAPASAATSGGNPWNGTWKLDAQRSSPEAKEQAADGYRFLIQPDGRIRWEIPSLQEVVEGKIDGKPMAIHRAKPTPGLTLSVRPEGPRVLLYQVARNGKVEGEGRMTLVENGKAWVDIVWPVGKPEFAAEVVYIKQ